MKTVDKTMFLLEQFSLEQLEIGLNDLARLTGEDKAVTRRILISLQKHGYIEQNPENKKYHLGHSFLSLARLREATVPMLKACQIVARWLCAKSDETVHVGMPSTKGMSTACFELPTRGNIINLRPAERYPYHASASGLAYLTFCRRATREKLLELDRQKLTRFTLVELADLERFFEETRSRGYAFSRNTVEVGVCSIALPFFGDGVDPAGTVAIAVPDSNMSPERELQLAGWLEDAVSNLEIAMTGATHGVRRRQGASSP